MSRAVNFLFGLYIFLLLPGLIPAQETPVLVRPYFEYYADNLQFAPMIDSAVADARGRLIKILGDSLNYTPQIYLETSRESFATRIGGAIPDWGAAVAIPYRGQIVLKSPAHFNLGKSLFELVRHEYAHLALADRFGPTRPPRWLDEGLAMYIASEWGWYDNIALSQAAVMGHLIPLEEVERLPLFPEGKAHTAYAQSYMAVKYVLETYGIESFQILLDNLARRAAIDDAMMAATGSSFQDFEKEYITYLKGQYNLLTLFIDMSYLWIFLAGVIVAGFFLYLRRRRKAFEKWDKEEQYHSTDFDFGNPETPEKTDDEDKPWA